MPPPPQFPYWFFRGLGDEPLMVLPFDAPRDLGWDVLDPMFVVSYLEGWLLDSEARATLYDVYAALFGPLPTTAWGLGEEHLSLKPLLRRAFERQDLVVLAPRRINAVLPGPAQVPSPQVPPKFQPPALPKAKVWVEIELFQGKDPVAGEAYVITPRGGVPASGTLDREGFARLEAIDPGTCKIEFPNLDAREWGFGIVLARRGAGLDEIVRVAPDSAHAVSQGEDMFAIAKANTFRTWQTIYGYDANAPFRVLRPNPQILFPGDTLVIPGKQQKIERVSTEATHRFHVSLPTRLLRLRLLDEADAPIIVEPYQLFIDGTLLSTGKATGSDGILAEQIPIDATSGKLTVKNFEWELVIAELNPIDRTDDNGVSGAQGRLHNLGYDVGTIDGILGPKTRQALRDFQMDHAALGLKVNGSLDQATKAALVGEYGC